MSDASAASARGPGLDEATLKFGLLMESAQAHQKMAEAHLERLRDHTQDLDEVVRDEIRRSLAAELTSLTAECERAARALRRVQRVASLRGASWLIAVAVLGTVVPLSIVRLALPSAAEITALRTRRDGLEQNIAGLERRGARIEWRTCGDAGRLCVRVERSAPVYGEKADYLVVKGY